MHRIDGPGATVDGLFTEGDPTSGMPATTVTGNWLNAVQEEIANAVEEAGLVLDKPDNTQLADAIRIIAGLAAGWSTGDVKMTMKTTADSGWILCNDGTIGKAGSGATTRANDDCQALFTLLWTNVSNAYAAVSGGRGASAAADWAAGKTIALTKLLGRSLALAGSGASLTARTLGQTVGAESHTLSQAEMPAHSHSGTTGSENATHTHNSVYQLWDAHSGTTGISMGGGTSGFAIQPSGGQSSNHQHAFTTNSVGSGTAHNIMQPTAFLNAMIKL